MDVEFSVFESFYHFPRGIFHRYQRRHGEFVLVGERRFDEARIDQIHPDSPRGQIKLEGFGEIDQGCLCRTIDQAAGQAAVACDARYNGNGSVRVAAECRRQDRARIHRADQIGFDQSTRLRGIQLPRAYGLVAARQQHGQGIFEMFQTTSTVLV